MISCAMPSDVLNYKPHLLGNFTTRQLLFGLAGGVCGFIVFLVCPDSLPLKTRIIITACPMIPFFIMGWMTLYGQPLEKILPSFIMDNFIAPPVRKKEIHQEGFEKMNDKKAGKDDKPAAKSKEYKEIQ